VRFGAIVRVGLAGILLLPVIAHAGEKDKPKDGEQMVDSGSFGVFMNGRRVATETFSVQQSANGSVVSSQFKTDDATNKAAQSSELQLTPGAEIRKYEWKELSPGKAQATVAPNNDFLMEHISAGPDDKPVEQPFLLPASTSILDDYFFIHREILIWRYLATACRKENATIQCPANQKTQFGTMNPHQRSSVPLSLEFTGRDKVTIRGAERELNKFVLRSEGGDWTIWVDDQFKLQRILITSDATEVVRD
jgi:hypothetical protein